MIQISILESRIGSVFVRKLEKNKPIKLEKNKPIISDGSLVGAFIASAVMATSGQTREGYNFPIMLFHILHKSNLDLRDKNSITKAAAKVTRNLPEDIQLKIEQQESDGDVDDDALETIRDIVAGLAEFFRSDFTAFLLSETVLDRDLFGTDSTSDITINIYESQGTFDAVQFWSQVDVTYPLYAYEIRTEEDASNLKLPYVEMKVLDENGKQVEGTWKLIKIGGGRMHESSEKLNRDWRKLMVGEKMVIPNYQGSKRSEEVHRSCHAMPLFSNFWTEAGYNTLKIPKDGSDGVKESRQIGRAAHIDRVSVEFNDSIIRSKNPSWVGDKPNHLLLERPAKGRSGRIGAFERTILMNWFTNRECKATVGVTELCLWKATADNKKIPWQKQSTTVTDEVVKLISDKEQEIIAGDSITKKIPNEDLGKIGKKYFYDYGKVRKVILKLHRPEDQRIKVKDLVVDICPREYIF